MPAHTEDSFNDQTSMINETNPRIAYDILNSSSSGEIPKEVLIYLK